MGNILLGVGLVAVGLFVLIPVAVNLPDSWEGAVLAIALLILGGIAIGRGIVSSRKERQGR
jgi:hypothetical protein